MNISDDVVQHSVKSCKCLRHMPKPVRPLTELILDCWQREYDTRPYENFILHGKVYRSKMYRNISKADMRVLINFLKNRKKIKFLEIAYMSLPQVVRYDKEFAQLICGLDKVCLIDVDVSVELLKNLAENAEFCSTRMLRLTGNELTMEHAKHLRCFLMHAPNLLYLDVGYCSLDECSFAMVADGVHKSSSLKAVDMSRIVNRSRVSVVDENKLALVAAVVISKYELVEVHLKHCGFDSDAIRPIVEYVSQHKCLLYLDLGSNKIEGNGTLLLFSAIKKQNRMVGLDISNNRLGEQGGEIIAHHLPETKLRYLDIGLNSIPGKQLSLILSTIKKTFPIRILNVTGNAFDSQAAATLHRHLLTGTLLLDSLDVSVTFDSDVEEFRIVPCDNNKARYNERYLQVANPKKWPSSFFLQVDDGKSLTWNQKDPRKILVNGMFVGPIVVKRDGRVVKLKDEVDEDENVACLQLCAKYL